MYIRVVKPHVAKNPFARELARGELAKELVKQKIALYMMEDGEECTERMEGLGLTLSIVGTAADIEPKILPHDHRLKILRGGLGACQQIINAFIHALARAFTYNNFFCHHVADKADHDAEQEAD